MKIANPWPTWQHIRYRCKPGDLVGICGACNEIEVPDDVEEAILEPVDKGRSDAQVVAQGRIWSKKWGLLDIVDHMKKQELEKQQAEMEALREKDRVRREAELAAREKEAKERAEKAEKAEKEAKEKAEAKDEKDRKERPSK